nr:helix-turn-helix transcriptional regulator [Faecalimonas umbilicata]
MEYWERIKALREDRDLTQKNICTYLNIAQNTYSQYENGKREIPISILIKLCLYFGVSSDYILGLSDKK